LPVCYACLTSPVVPNKKMNGGYVLPFSGRVDVPRVRIMREAGADAITLSSDTATLDGPAPLTVIGPPAAF
ncbi:UNVERIFIED_CONTAM: hypothetical protein OHV15_16700, partial [Microbacterium sp. SLM126]